MILFSNEARRTWLIAFREEAAFGIRGIAIGPESRFMLVFRGVATQFRLSTFTIPPG
jgi:hypothetical protein